MLSFLCCVTNFCFVSSFPGRIVSDSDHFHNKKHIWPEGYTAFRKFISIIGNYPSNLSKPVCSINYSISKFVILIRLRIVYLVYKNLVADQNSVTSYKMEVLRNSDTKARPLFRVSSEDGVQVSCKQIANFFL